MIYDLFVQNRMTIEIVYTAIIVLSCLLCAIKINSLYSISMYRGLKYFRNAFIFFSIAFLMRYVALILAGTKYYIMIFPLFEYAITMGGFYLAFSLVWKKLAKSTTEIFLHIIAISIAVLDYLYADQYFMFITQLAVLLYAITVSYSNYAESKKPRSQLFFIALTLAFFGFMVNFLELILRPIIPFFLMYVMAITAGIFLLFLIGVYKAS